MKILSAFAIIVCCAAMPQVSRPGNNQFGGNNFNGRDIVAQQRFPVSTSTASPISPITSTTAFTQCTTNCPVLPIYNPICGSDRRNYSNDQRLACHNMCGRRLDNNWIEITALRSGSCTPGGRIDLTTERN